MRIVEVCGLCERMILGMVLQNDFTQGDVNSHILRFSLPLLLGNLFQSLYNVVDMYFVGKYLGTEGLCAVSVSGPVVNVLFMTIAGMSVGVSVTIGMHAGRNDERGIRETAGTAISLYALCAICITIIGLLFTPTILTLIATPPEAFEMAVSYLRIVFCGVLFTLGYNLICAFQRGFGDSCSGLLFVAIATCTNALLDILFVRDMHMGVEGAALATVVSQALAFLLGIFYFHLRKHVISFAPTAWRMQKSRLQELVRIGLPSALQQLQLNISHLTLNGIVNSYGLVASAAYGIGVKLDSFAILPGIALNDAVSSFTSQNIAAGQEGRALKGIRVAWKLALSINAVLMVLILLFAPQFAKIFNSDPAVVGTAAQYLRVSCYMYLLYAFVHPMQGFVRGSGNAMFTLTNGLQAQYIVRIPMALLLSKVFGMGILGVAVAWISAPAFSCFTYLRFVKSELWKKQNKADAEGNEVTNGHSSGF